MFTISGGLVADSDLVSLSVYLRLHNKTLYDDAVGARHELHPKAAAAIAILRQPTTVSSWFDKMHNLGLSTENMHEIIAFLNSIAGLKIKRNMRGYIVLLTLRIEALFRGFRFRHLAVRSLANFTNLSGSVAVILLPLLCLIPLTVIILYAFGFSYGWLVKLSSIFLIVLWMSTTFHELTHSLFISDRTNCVFIRRGMRIGLLHKTLPIKKEIASAVLGPIVGIWTSLLIGGVLWAIFVDPTLFIICLFVSILHSASWLPFYGDGHTLLKYVRKYSYGKA